MNEKIEVIIDARMVSEKLHGIARYTYELICGNSEKVNYTLLVNNIESSQKIFGNINNIKYIELKSEFLSVLEQFELPMKLNKYKGKAIFHTPSFVSSPFIKIDTIMTIHDLNHIKFSQFYSWFHKYYYRLIVKKSAERSKKIITVSNFAKSEIVEWLNCDVDKVLVTYNGINIKSFNRGKVLNQCIKQKYKLPDKYILYIGNTKPHKNIKRLIESFSNIDDRNIKLVINNKATDELLEVIEKLGINDKVIFIGFIEEDDLGDIYSQAEVFVFPSLYEGFGLPPLEALASGTKVVTSNNTALGELFNNIAITVDPYSVKDITSGINKALNSINNNFQEMHKYLKFKFRWEELCELTLNEYIEILNFRSQENEV